MAVSEVLSVLHDFGLSESEISVYLALLESGARPASLISKRAGLKRGQTYNIFSTLMGMGLVQTFTKNNVQHFVGSPPQSLVSILENRVDELKRQKEKIAHILPFLENSSNLRFKQPKIRFFQGAEGVKEIYEDTLRSGITAIYGVSDLGRVCSSETNPKLCEWNKNYVRRRAEKDIWYLGIINKSPYADVAFPECQKYKRQLKMLRGYELPIEINIYGPKVSMMSSGEDMIGVIIEDERIATTLRNVHQAMWKLLPDYSVQL